MHKYKHNTSRRTSKIWNFRGGPNSRGVLIKISELK